MNTEHAENMEEKTAANPLGSEPVGKLMRQFAVPSVVSLMINTLYNMVDQIFIGQGVGYLGNAATNVVLPIMTFLIALGLLIGDGTASYMSLMLGHKKPERAALGVGNACILTLVLGIAFMILFSVFLEPLCWFFGATENNISYCLDYGRFISLGALPCLIASGFGSIFRADGRPKITLIGLLIGTATNFILDPVFIFVCGWGVRGAALATILGQIFNSVFYIFCAFHFKSVKLTRNCFQLKGYVCKKICALGMSSFITQAAGAAIMIVMNNLLVLYGEQSVYGPDIPLAAYGIVMKVYMLLISCLNGIATGCQPIWGYNYGCGQYGRVRECFRKGLGIGFFVSLIALFIFEVFPMQIVSLFGADSDLYVEFAVGTFRKFLCCCFMTSFATIIGIFFQALGKPGRAAFICMSRQILFLIPIAIILGKIGGVEGLLWGGPLADSLSGLVALIILGKSWKKLFSAAE